MIFAFLHIMTTTDANSEFQYDIWQYLNTENPEQGYVEYYTGKKLELKKKISLFSFLGGREHFCFIKLFCLPLFASQK